MYSLGNSIAGDNSVNLNTQCQC